MKIFVLLILVLFSGCVSYPKEVSSVTLGNESKFILIDSKKFKDFSALQKITVYWQDKKFTFNVQLENLEGNFHIVGLTPVFSRSFLISYSSGILNYEEHPYFRYPVNPENMLADFQIAYADSSYLNNFKFEESGLKRVLTENKKTLVTVDYSHIDKWKAVVKLKNHTKGYSLKIETLQYEAL